VRGFEPDLQTLRKPLWIKSMSLGIVWKMPVPINHSLRKSAD